MINAEHPCIAGCRGDNHTVYRIVYSTEYRVLCRAEVGTMGRGGGSLAGRTRLDPSEPVNHEYRVYCSRTE